MSTPYILVVDDEPDIRQLVMEILIDEGYEVAVAESGSEAREQRRKRRPDLILLDIWMPDIDGISLLREWQEGEGGEIQVVMMSGHGNVETAVEATRLGAFDYLEKPLSYARLLLTVERALAAIAVDEQEEGASAPVVIEPVGHSSTMQSLRDQVRRLAHSTTPILLIGESGSGKETIARHLHSQSANGGRPMVDIAVAAIAGNSAATELFGNESGGQTQIGLLEQANGTTLYLDGVNDMDLHTQALLVSALHSQGFQRIGGSERVPLRARIIASTPIDLSEEVALGRFRDDLFYQLNVVPLQIPPLRDHCEDVPELLNFYLSWFADHEKLPYRRFSMAAQNRLRNHTWPGNVRELRNLVQRLLILSSSEEIELDEVNDALSGTIVPSSSGTIASTLFDQPLREAREAFERLYLEYQLREVDGNMSQLAKRAGMERTHLYRKLRALGIDPKEVVG
jgi:two-component system nitrogen regulation response regulator NtrX